MDYSRFYTKDLLGEAHYIKSIGDFSYGAPTVMEWGENAQLTIGKFCSIAEKVIIFLGGNHNTHWVSTYPFSALSEAWKDAEMIQGHPATKGDVIIGNDVWIGYGATILSGVKIGNGAVIGARSVVASDVEPYAIVAGNPAKNIKKRFTDEEIETLNKISWWNWDMTKIQQFLPLLCSGAIKTFIEKSSDYEQ